MPHGPYPPPHGYHRLWALLTVLLAALSAFGTLPTSLSPPVPPWSICLWQSNEVVEFQHMALQQHFSAGSEQDTGNSATKIWLPRATHESIENL